MLFVQCLILANSARGRAAVALIQQAISNPHLFHFGELIDHDNIAALDGCSCLPPHTRSSCTRKIMHMLRHEAQIARVTRFAAGRRIA